MNKDERDAIALTSRWERDNRTRELSNEPQDEDEQELPQPLKRAELREMLLKSHRKDKKNG